MENGELAQLKVVYDELWRDARTMVRDMNRTIKSVFLVGFFMLLTAGMQFLSAHQIYMKILGRARALVSILNEIGQPCQDISLLLLYSHSLHHNNTN